MTEGEETMVFAIGEETLVAAGGAAMEEGAKEAEAEADDPTPVESTMLDESHPTLLVQRRAEIKENFPPLAYRCPIPSPRLPSSTSPRPSFSPIQPPPTRRPATSIVSDALTPARADISVVRRSSRIANKSASK